MQLLEAFRRALVLSTIFGHLTLKRQSLHFLQKHEDLSGKIVAVIENPMLRGCDMHSGVECNPFYRMIGRDEGPSKNRKWEAARLIVEKISSELDARQFH